VLDVSNQNAYKSWTDPGNGLICCILGFSFTVAQTVSLVFQGVTSSMCPSCISKLALPTTQADKGSKTLAALPFLSDSSNCRVNHIKNCPGMTRSSGSLARPCDSWVFHARQKLEVHLTRSNLWMFGLCLLDEECPDHSP
jgi:hypothetical protein